MSEEDIKSGLNGVHQPNLQENIELMNNNLYSAGEFISNFCSESGQISRKPNLNEIIEPRFLKKI